MNIIQQLIADVSRHQRSLEERLAVLKDEQSKTKKILSQVARHRERLERDHGNGEATLPLAPPDEEEEEATDEVDDADAMHAAHPVVRVEPLIPGEWSPGYEVPETTEEPVDTMAKEWEPASLTPEQNSAASEKGLSPLEYIENVSEKPIRRRKAKAAAEE